MDIQSHDDGSRVTVTVDTGGPQAPPHHLLNALRLALGMVPQVGANPSLDALDEVFAVEKNETGMTNEKLCHRVAMLPMAYTREQVAGYESGELSIDMTAAGRVREVTAADIAGVAPSVFPKGRASGEHVVLAYLQPGKSLKMSWRPSVGTAAVHAAFDNISQRTLCNVPDEAVMEERFREWAQGPEGERARAQHADPRAFFEAAYGERCFAMTPAGLPAKVCLTVESENRATSALDFVRWGVDVLEERVNAFEEFFNRDSRYSEAGPVARFELDAPSLGFVGQLVKEAAYDLFVAPASGRGPPVLSWCACRTVHPLDTMFVLSMCPPAGERTSEDASRGMVRDAVSVLYEQIGRLRLALADP